MAGRKRLSDAECAAEYWRAEAQVEWADRLLTPDLDEWVSLAEAWERFATMPHAFPAQASVGFMTPADC